MISKSIGRIGYLLVSSSSTKRINISSLRSPAAYSTAININQEKKVQNTSKSKGQKDKELVEEKWDLWVGICLERKPIITKEFTPLEKKYASFLAKYEFQNSYISNHQIRHFKDKDILERLKKGEIDRGTIQTAQDFEDLSNVEFEEFKQEQASRITEADKMNDTRSLKRALSSPLLLVTEQKLGNDLVWTCPQAKLIPGETLVETGERVLKEICPHVQARIMGNIPSGFYKYKYPKSIRESKKSENTITGGKVFFYKAEHLEGNLEINESNNKIIKDYQWLTRNELGSKLQERYWNEISKFLIFDFDENLGS